MKKLLLLSALLIFACSSDDSDSEINNSEVTIQNVTADHSRSNGCSFTNHFTYLNGNPETNTKNMNNNDCESSWKKVYTYSNNLKTQEDIYELNNETGNYDILMVSFSYEYDSQDRLVREINEDGETNFSYSNDNLTVTSSSGGNAPSNIIRNYDSFGNLIQRMVYVNGDFSQGIKYTYDSYNSPYTPQVNNKLSQTLIIDEFGTLGATGLWEYSYNEFNFPVEAILTNEGVFQNSVQYTYTYN